MLHINSQFSSGNIVINHIDSQQARLSINADHLSEFKQWFHFNAFAEVGAEITFCIEDAAECAYPKGWEDYQVCASVDGEEWFRVPTDFNDGQLTFKYQFDVASVFFAYFAPYSYERHLSLVNTAQLHPLVRHELLGETLDGRAMNLLHIGNSAAPKKAWVIARQHPGETMAEWFIEGFLNRLLDPNDPIATRLLEQVQFFVVPNMNPDGTERGHLRTNAVGVNLNREWLSPSMEKSPEVFLVREKMAAEGVDLFLDVHGDEGLPYNFVAGCEGNPGYNDRIANLESVFKQTFINASPDFQDRFGYPKDEPGQANLTIASSWVGQQFDCLSLTLEMPFKDNADLPDRQYGWSPERCQRLGEAVLQPLLAVTR